MASIYAFKTTPLVKLCYPGQHHYQALENTRTLLSATYTLRSFPLVSLIPHLLLKRPDYTDGHFLIHLQNMLPCFLDTFTLE